MPDIDIDAAVQKALSKEEREKHWLRDWYSSPPNAGLDLGSGPQQRDEPEGC
jgi:hypothetical protein